mmetsp:Transcript_18198/g.36430  ORF Transcript_18198/g.36430 Transcript_18198/m.36430 type:complete len:292 (-) Transcript_18198:193-1068(-)
METKISIKASRERRLQSPEALRRRSTRRSIVDAYIGADEIPSAPPSNPRLSSQSSNVSETSTTSASSPKPSRPSLKVDTENTGAPNPNTSKTWSGTKSQAMYPAIPSFNPAVSPRNSGQDGTKRLGYLGLSSPRSGSMGGVMEDEESQATPLPQSPQRGEGGQGSAFGLSPLRLFKFGAEGGGGDNDTGKQLTEPNYDQLPQPPILYASTADAMSSIQSGMLPGSLRTVDDTTKSPSPTHVATGFALGAGAAVMLSNNGQINTKTISKAVAFGGVAGAGSVYGLHSAFKKP